MSARSKRSQISANGAAATSPEVLPVCWSAASNDQQLELENSKKKTPRFTRTEHLGKDYVEACSVLRINTHPHIMLAIDPDYKMVDPENIEEGFPSLKRRPENEEKKEEEAKAEEGEEAEKEEGKKDEGKKDEGEEEEKLVPEVREIRITGMALDKGTVLALKMAVPDSTLRTLRLWNCGITSSVFEELVQLLNVSQIENLTLEENPLEDGALFAKLVEGKSPLLTLSLQSNGIRDEDAAKLLSSLKSNGKLLALNMSKNDLGSGSVQAFSAAMKGNTTLTALDLSRNRIGDDDAVALLTELSPPEAGGKKGKKGAKAFVHLNLSFNAVGEKGRVPTSSAQ
mmetsp:Transcript_11462/g.18357  ORF Transcript_11462/g.18357 Transcript_11462/m.18357 type:complete len:341 (-) Transcript_11462:284-1306(-)